MKHSFVCCLVFLLSINAFAHLGHRPDGHAPIGVMGDHGHKQGESMVSLRWMKMNMQGLQSGANELSTSKVFSTTSYMMAPESMEMDMYMLGVMYGITDKVTAMFMLPYLENDMTMRRKMQNDTLTMTSSGIGDVTLGAVYTLVETGSQRDVMTLGLSLPTGATDVDRNGTRSGYSMQLGSGSYALEPALVSSRYWDEWSIGGQLGFKYYLNDNDKSYRKGSKYYSNVWGMYNWTENVSSSLRLEYISVDPIQGIDNKISASMSPVNSPNNHHGQKIFVHLGSQWLGTEVAAGHRLAFEVGVPIYQYLNGPQMKTEWVSTLGWQKAF